MLLGCFSFSDCTEKTTPVDSNDSCEQQGNNIANECNSTGKFLSPSSPLIHSLVHSFNHSLLQQGILYQMNKVKLLYPPSCTVNNSTVSILAYISVSLKVFQPTISLQSIHFKYYILYIKLMNICQTNALEESDYHSMTRYQFLLNIPEL